MTSSASSSSPASQAGARLVRLVRGSARRVSDEKSPAGDSHSDSSPPPTTKVPPYALTCPGPDSSRSGRNVECDGGYREPHLRACSYRDLIFCACRCRSQRTLAETSLPRWAWHDTSTENPSTVDFVIMHDRSIDVILKNQRGEGFVKQVFRLVLANCSGVNAGIVVDIGTNTGYYAMASAAHGCPVAALDAQPGCSKWFEAARAANDANSTRAGAPAFFSQRRVRLLPRPVSSNAALIEMDRYACWVMHKTDVRVRRRRRNPRLAGDAQVAEQEVVRVPAGRVAARPVGPSELNAFVGAAEPILLAKVDTEGAELSVLNAMEALLPRVSNLIVEVAPGWWPLYVNKSSGAARSRAASKPGAPPSPLRLRGAEQLARFLTSRASGGWGFEAALTSTGRFFASAERLREYVLSMGNNGYWHQADIWFARDGALMRSACRLICLQQQSADRAKWCNALGASRDGACARRARPRPHQAA